MGIGEYWLVLAMAHDKTKHVVFKVLIANIQIFVYALYISEISTNCIKHNSKNKSCFSAFVVLSISVTVKKLVYMYFILQP